MNGPISPPTERLVYKVTQHASRSMRGALVDRGANGGIIGNDAKVMFQYDSPGVDVCGIDNHKLTSLKLVDASAKTLSNYGPVIIIMRQFAYHGLQRTILSCPQIEHYKNKVDDVSMKVGGRQVIRCNDGFIVPINIINGLPYIEMTPHTDKEFKELPHVILTSGDPWDPRVVDSHLTSNPNWPTLIEDLDKGDIKYPFDIHGEYKRREPARANTEIDPPSSEAIEQADMSSPPVDEEPTVDDIPHEASYLEVRSSFRAEFYSLCNLNQYIQEVDFEYSSCQGEMTDTIMESVEPESGNEASRILEEGEFTDLQATKKGITVKRRRFSPQKYRHYFLNVPDIKIRKTFENTTQFAVSVLAGHRITQTMKSPFPAHNVLRRSEPVATDTIFADEPAIGTGGQTMAQFFVGRKSHVMDVYGIGSTKEFVNTLLDNIRRRGAPDLIITDAAKVEMSERVHEICRSFCIDDWSAEAKYQHQNFAERIWQNAQANLVWYMNWRNIPGKAWLLCLTWICHIMNCTAEKSLGWRPPLQVLTGQTIDISILLLFLFWDLVYVSRYEKDDCNYTGSDEANEVLCRFVGFEDHVGHAFTFKVLNLETNKIISRSRLRLADHMDNNLKAMSKAGMKPERNFIRTAIKPGEPMPTIDASRSPFMIDEDNPDLTHPEPWQESEDIEETDDPDMPTLLPRKMNDEKDDDDSYDSDDDEAIPPIILEDLRREYATDADPYRWIGTRIAKMFNDVLCFGTITQYHPVSDQGAPVWTAHYDDGDVEDYFYHQMIPLIGLREEHLTEDPTTKPPNVSAKTRKPSKKKGKPSSSKATRKSPRKKLRNNVAKREYVPNLPPGTKHFHPNARANPTSPLEETPMCDLPETGPDDDPSLLAEHLHPDTHVPGEDVIRMKDHELFTQNPTVAGLDPENMVGRTFLMPEAEDRSRQRAKIVERIIDHKKQYDAEDEVALFKVRVGDDKYEEIVAYSDIVDYIEDQDGKDGLWKFEEILDHKCVKPSDPDYKGCSINVLLKWSTGEKTWEPIKTRKYGEGVLDTDHVSLALYAGDKGLLDTPGWKYPMLKKVYNNKKTLVRTLHQAQLHSFRTRPIYMYGYRVPRNHAEAMILDEENGNKLWYEAEQKELAQIDEYSTFEEHAKGYKPEGYKKITVHLVYACKHDGRHKARLVAGGHLTETPIDSVYSSVVTLRGTRLLTFIAELNGLDTYCTDIGNAYLESYTKEKVYIVAGPEFGERAGKTLIIRKALYGLKTSGVRWHERFADVLRDMEFFPSRAEPDIWMKDCGDHYEYIAVYVDDLLLVSKNPKLLLDTLTNKYDFKLKGSGNIEFYLGCDYFRDDDGVLCYAPRKYIRKTVDNYERIFKKKPKEYKSPLDKNDHPELDDSDLLDMEGQKLYQSLIGSLQWAIQIGRFDLSVAVMTMSRFRAAPRKGHLARVCRIIGYLSKMRQAIVRIRTSEPDYSNIPEKVFDWDYTCYGGAKEEIPKDIPRGLGQRVILTAFVDANLLHDLISGKAVTGILHMANKTPVDWYAKLQSTVETATFGSEYVAARTCTEQQIDLRNTFRYLGVPVHGPSFVFGDNESVVNTASVPHSKLGKRHNILSYHRTREAIAAGIIRFHWLKGNSNPADILSKHWDYASIWSQLRPLLFWDGDTADIEVWDLAKFSSAHKAKD